MVGRVLASQQSVCMETAGGRPYATAYLSLASHVIFLSVSLAAFSCSLTLALSAPGTHFPAWNQAISNQITESSSTTLLCSLSFSRETLKSVAFNT